VTSLLRPGLALLAAVEVGLGLWTLLFPASFYADVPTVDATPPFSEHLFRDFGGATLGLAVVLAGAAMWTERRLIVVALLAYLAFSGPHLVFHLGHLPAPVDRGPRRWWPSSPVRWCCRWRCSSPRCGDRSRWMPPANVHPSRHERRAGEALPAAAGRRAASGQ
jgi:hypothetical protein